MARRTTTFSGDLERSSSAQLWARIRASRPPRERNKVLRDTVESIASEYAIRQALRELIGDK